MPKIAILSDIHANLPALKAVLREVARSGAGMIAVAGDIIGYGENPRACVELLRKLPIRAVLGNHETFARLVRIHGVQALEADWESSPVYAGLVCAVRQLSAEQLDWLFGLPWVERIAPEALMAHATLIEPEKWHYLESLRDALPSLQTMRNLGVEVAFFGHTHDQKWFAHPDADGQPELLDDGRLHLPEGSVCAITAGSVGQPRGATDENLATWLLWDRDARMVEFRKTVLR